MHTFSGGMKREDQLGEIAQSVGQPLPTGHLGFLAD